jgi:hypothetical protein
MVYTNHIYANVTASDDSRANVYAVVLSNVDANTHSDANIIEYITSRIDTNAPNANGVYRLTQDGMADGAGIPPGTGLHTDVEMNLFTLSSNLATGSAALLDIATDYNVCIVAIDEHNNMSGLERSVTGNIVERAAPVQTAVSSVVNVHQVDDTSNVTVNLTMSSDVYFEYYAALFQSLPTPTNVETFLSNHPSDAHVVYGNVTTGFDSLLQTPATLTETPEVFTRAYQSTGSNINYDFAADTTRARYVGVFMKNTDPRTQHIAKSVVVNTISAKADTPPVNYTLNLTTADVFDRSANVAFNLTGGPTSNTVIYYKTFDTAQSEFNTGAFKDDLFLNPQGTFSPVTANDVVRVSQYVDAATGGYVDMVFDDTYYVYARSRNTVTGEMSPVSVLAPFTTGKNPLLQGVINQQTRTSNANVDLAGTIIVDQSNVDVYIGITESAAYDDANVVGHLLNDFTANLSTPNYGLSNTLKEGVLRVSELVPVNGLITLGPGTVLDKYYTDIFTNTNIDGLGGAGGQNVYMYVVDENELGSVFQTTVANVSGYTVVNIDANIEITEAFDRSFSVRTENAAADKSHYIMAFANTTGIDSSTWTNYHYDNFTKTANVVVSTDGITSVTVSTYFDDNFENESGIVPGNVYNIYTVAENRFGQYFHSTDLSILTNQTAARPPVINSFNVDFDT